MPIKFIVLIITTIYQAIACQLENRQPPPGKLFDVGGYRLHLSVLGSGSPTIIIDHSLGGIEGYLLIEELAKLAKVCIYDRAGYGWSDISPYPRTSDRIVTELNTLLNQAEIAPPYILLGDSFGSYNMRLYAHRFPEKVVGMVLTDGLHEKEMLRMPLQLQLLKFFFISGFAISALGSILGIIRVLKVWGIFELLKPELKKFSKNALNPVKRSFCRAKHWITMTREMLALNSSACQVRIASQFGQMPIVNIKSSHFFKPAFWTTFIPLRSADKLRDKMHAELSTLSTDCIQLPADSSSHFVWTDQPDVIVNGVKIILDKVQLSCAATFRNETD